MNKQKFNEILPKKQRFTLSNVTILESCEDFYNFLIHHTKTAEEIHFACLALGFDEKSIELGDALKEKVESKKTVVILADKTRNLTNKKIVEMFKEKKLENNIKYISAESSKIFPNRINEALGVFHSKIYILDNFTMLTGANLYKEYYENRVDRYYVFEDDIFANEMKREMFYDAKEYKKKHFIEKTQSKNLKNVNFTKQLQITNTNLTLIPFDEKEESSILSWLFNTDYKQMHIASAYPNLTSTYLHVLKNKRFNLYAPSPKNNTFNSFGIVNNIITNVYGYANYYILQKLPLCTLFEFVKYNHSFHKKGIWVFFDNCAISIIGSSNFNVRSNLLDIEQNWIMYSEDVKMIDAWKQEVDSLKKDCKIRTAKDIENRRRILIVIIFFLFNFLF
ncbi:pgs1 [Ecytonucleospora hepatopenaei]|uniref:CDP-diacylglycerol--glycerol-3-phosphate 3-phosphatidyltransferase n=1 Tax=Ecytonucleospora hepatopenaei TaxID=646526 RepID=A0A1W0E789_9MICR|nr:pgs1 [Ecytonucleospora hepatopenaei]